MSKRLLILMRDPNWYGGVVNFINSLEANLSKNIEVNRLQIGHRKDALAIWTWLKLLVPLWDGMRLARCLLFERYDLVHINPSLNRSSLVRDGFFLLIIKLCRLRNIMIFIHGWEDGVAQTIENKAFLKGVFVWLFGTAPVIYVLASRFKRILVEWGINADKVYVVTTMFDGEQFKGVARNCTDDEVRLLFLSRFERDKGVYELLNAFKRIVQNNSKLRLVFAGTGPEDKRMRQWVDEAGLTDLVTFTGYVRDKEKSQVFMNADIFVFPSYYGEGCPVSLLEAMAAGLPVITSNAGGIGDFFINGKNGYLLGEITTDSIEAALLKLLNRTEELVRMGKFNQKIAWENYEAAVVSKEIEGMYAKLLVSRYS